MATLKDVKKFALTINAKVEDDKIGHSHECRVEAPKGYIWKCADIHELVADAYIPWKPDYNDIIKRMKYGVEICKDPECEWCNS